MQHIATAHAQVRKDIALEKKELAQEEGNKKRKAMNEKKAAKEREEVLAKQAANKAARAPDSDGFVMVAARRSPAKNTALRPRRLESAAGEGETGEARRSNGADQEFENTPPTTPHETHKGYVTGYSANATGERTTTSWSERPPSRAPWRAKTQATEFLFLRCYIRMSSRPAVCYLRRDAAGMERGWMDPTSSKAPGTTSTSMASWNRGLSHPHTPSR